MIRFFRGTVRVRITGAETYDLSGELADNG